MSQITRTERIQAFLFLLIGVVVTVAVVLTLVGVPFVNAKRTYFLRFDETVTGLPLRAPVLYKGVECGKVADIRVAADDPAVIEVRLALDESAPVHVSTEAVIATASILGPYHIELTGSRASSPRLPEMSEIPASSTTLAKLLATGETLGDQLTKVLGNVEKLTDSGQRRRFSETLTSLNDTLRTIKQSIDRWAPKIDRIVKNAADITDYTQRFIQRNEDHFDRIVRSMSSSADRIKTLLASGTLEETTDAVKNAMRRVVDELTRSAEALRLYMSQNQVAPHLERGVAAVERMEAQLRPELSALSAQTRSTLNTEVSPALSELRRTTAAIGRLVELLERQPQALVFGQPPAPKPLPGGGR